jgi:hypothetical protein
VNPPDAEDIIDEALFYFRANVLFRNFEVCLFFKILKLAGRNGTLWLGVWMVLTIGSHVTLGRSRVLQTVPSSWSLFTFRW